MAEQVAVVLNRAVHDNDADGTDHCIASNDEGAGDGASAPHGPIAPPGAPTGAGGIGAGPTVAAVAADADGDAPKIRRHGVPVRVGVLQQDRNLERLAKCLELRNNDVVTVADQKYLTRGALPRRGTERRQIVRGSQAYLPLFPNTRAPDGRKSRRCGHHSCGRGRCGHHSCSHRPHCDGWRRVGALLRKASGLTAARWGQRGALRPLLLTASTDAGNDGGGDATPVRTPSCRRRARTELQVRSCTVRGARRAAAPRPTRRPRPAVRAATAPRHPAVLAVDTPSPTARRDRPDKRRRRRDQPISGGDPPPV